MDSFLVEQNILDELDYTMTARKINVDSPKKEVNEIKLPPKLSLPSFRDPIHKGLSFMAHVYT